MAIEVTEVMFSDHACMYIHAERRRSRAHNNINSCFKAIVFTKSLVFIMAYLDIMCSYASISNMSTVM